MLFAEIMDSIAQWMEALYALPKICCSSHLQEAAVAIPIGANVRLGPVSPLSESNSPRFISRHSLMLLWSRKESFQSQGFIVGLQTCQIIPTG